ncbi:hypothetical protein L484_014473 [Morus notabilis]|uniref:Uncharacterized protein n=1 Tax=Morus notabilis TaxID=981085 RepID=W9RU31_9ROSA|nr:hypothetical protein L484_014473 [Morus notabilis]
MELSEGFSVVLHLRPPSVDDDGNLPRTKQNKENQSRFPPSCGSFALLLRVAGDYGGEDDNSMVWSLQRIWEIVSLAPKELAKEDRSLRMAHRRLPHENGVARSDSPIGTNTYLKDLIRSEVLGSSVRGREEIHQSC